MKRLWIGVGFLIVMLAVAIFLTVLFDSIHTPLSEDLRQASRLAMAEDWEKATALTQQARADWKKYREFIAAVADHEPLEKMEYLLDQLDVYADLRRTVDFSAVCVELAAMADAMLESQSLTWWNFL
ncbi:MAG: DUF4363 family protein [Oscillospiraceae bacterium]|nr:DUF4363 family protein [Oscillospiraceae bacterium]